jgi:hypothetical protein
MKIIFNETMLKVWHEQATSLFYDKQRYSDLYFNLKGISQYKKLAEKIQTEVGFQEGKLLEEFEYSWFLRQCLVPFIEDYVAYVYYIQIEFMGLLWYVYYLENKEENYHIIHIQYE